MTPVPLYFHYDNPEATLKAAKAVGRRKDCYFAGSEFPEGKGFAVMKGRFIIEKHIVRK